MIDKVDGLLPSIVYDELADTCSKFNINTPIRLAHFLSQCHHESAAFWRTEENLNYSARGLLATFPKYFNELSAETYAHNPIMIGSRVYANRMGNGDEKSQDGWLFRGRGFMQLTGRNSYAALNVLTDGDNIVYNPELVATKYRLLSAGWYWDSRNLNKIADRGSDQQVVADVTKVINGSYNGIESRQRLFDRYWNALS